MNETLAKLADLSWQKVFLIALGAGAFYYFMLFDNGSSIEAQTIAMEQQLNEQQTLLKKTEERMKNLEAFKDELANQEAAVREVMSFLPKQLNKSELLSIVQDRATQAGLRVVKTDVSDKTTRVEFYESLKMDATMVGTFKQITTFLSLLSKLPRLITVENIEMKMTDQATSEGIPRLEVTATLVAYRFVETANAPKPGEPGAPNANGQ
jgi:type IV pilus assembly protein PilO